MKAMTITSLLASSYNPAGTDHKRALLYLSKDWLCFEDRCNDLLSLRYEFFVSVYLVLGLLTGPTKLPRHATYTLSNSSRDLVTPKFCDRQDENFLKEQGNEQLNYTPDYENWQIFVVTAASGGRRALGLSRHLSFLYLPACHTASSLCLKLTPPSQNRVY